MYTLKLWQKENPSANSAEQQDALRIERFTVGRDREMDLYLAPYGADDRTAAGG